MNEIALGVYLAIMPRVDRDGWWMQRGFSNHENRHSIAASVSYQWDGVSIMVADLGRFSQFVAFTRDDSNYDPDSATGCAGECLPTTWGYNYQRSQLVALSRVYGDRTFVRLGGGLKRTTWTHARHESEDGTRSRRFSYRFTQTEYSLAPVVGTGYTFGEWRVVGQWVGDAYRIRERGYVCCPPSRDVWQFGVER